MPSKGLPVAQSWLLGAVLVGLVMALGVLNPRPLEVLRLATFDQMQRLAPRSGGSDGVVVVEIDEASLRELGQWPWPRTRLAQFVSTLRAFGAAGVGMDVLLAEPDRTSPRVAAQHWPDSALLQRWLVELPDHDDVLANALRGAAQPDARLPVVLGMSLDTAGRRQNVEVPARFVHHGTPTSDELPIFPAVLMPIPTLASAAAGVGAINFIGDGDGVVRRVPLVLDANGRLVPSLVVDALRLLEKSPNLRLDWTPHLESLRVGRHVLPATSKGEMWVHFGDTARFTRLSFADVIGNRVPGSAFKGRFVLLGASAKGLLDLRFTPRGDLVPGIYVHAEALTQVLSGQALARPWWLAPMEWIAAGLLAALIFAVTLRVNPTVGVVAGIVASMGSLALAFWGFSGARMLIDPSLIALSSILAAVLAGALRNQVAERQARWIRGAFARYISPNLVHHLVDAPGELQLGGKRHDCSFVFTDLQGFTRLVETLDPAEVARLINPYLEGMIEIAFKHDGTLDRIVGDAVAVMFSAPVPQADHAQRAIDCAIDMLAFSNRYADRIEAAGGEFGRTRIGVHTGEVIVGNFGGSALFDYRALGDPVNVTARLESANKYFGTQMSISLQVLTAANRRPPSRPIGLIVFQGKSDALEVHAYDDATGRMGDWAPLDAYLQAYRVLADGAIPVALERFAALAAAHPNDGLVRFHLTRLRDGVGHARIELESK